MRETINWLCSLHKGIQMESPDGMWNLSDAERFTVIKAMEDYKKNLIAAIKTRKAGASVLEKGQATLLSESA